MTHEEWLAQIKVGDPVTPYVNRVAKSPETVTGATRTQITIGKYARRIRFHRKNGKLSGRRKIYVTPVVIGRSDEVFGPLKTEESLRTQQLDDLRGLTPDHSLLDRYRAEAWPVERPAESLARIPTTSGVYLLWKDTELRYVGSSVYLPQRVKGQYYQRVHNGTVPDAITTISTDSLEEARALENRLIVQLLPIENRTALV